MMKRTTVWVISACCLMLGGPVSAEEPHAEAFRPSWKLGDQWTVETRCQQQQVSAAPQKSRAATWRFSVQAVDQVKQRPCWRLVVQPVDSDEPRMSVWVDQGSAAVCQIQTQLPTPDGYKTVTETYQPESGAAPVIGPSTLVPVAIPQFPDPNTKALDVFRYNTLSGPEGTKAVGELEFSTEIKQTFATPPADRVKNVLDEPRFKDLQDRPLIEVVLQSPDATVRQIWTAGAPWPLWSDDGATECRLISVQRVAESEVKNIESPTPNAGTADGDGLKTLEVSEGIERGHAKFTPWSGYWWPIREGRLLIPLAKYDQLTDHTAAAWEKQHNPPGPDVPQWHGYCHAWSAAAVLEREPRQGRVFRLESSRVGLDVGDQKGLVTACHTEDLANSWGDRYGDGAGSEDSQDLRPDLLWRLLKLHLGQQGVPLVLDIEAGAEVWNYPVYAYEIGYQPVSDESYQARLTLLMADDAVPPAFRGTKVAKQSYLFTFQMRGGRVVTGSGKWIGRSAQDHPDFAWYPFKAVATNPELKYSKVQRLVTPQPGPETPATPETPPTPPVTPPTPPVTPPTPPVTPPVDQPSEPPVTPPAGDATPPATVPETAETAQPVVLSPIELVALIANKASSFAFDATVDRFDGASYRPGETFFLRINSEKAGYLYVLQVDAAGTPALLYPTSGEDNRVLAGQSLTIRPAGIAGGFPVVGPAGVLRVKAVVTSRPLAFSGCLETAQVQQLFQPGGKPDDKTEAGKPEPHQEQPVGFRWPPTQQQQVRELLKKPEQEIDAGQLGCSAPEELLGPFAQDTTTFYVDTAPGRAGQDADQQQQPKRPQRPKKDAAPDRG